MSTSSTIWHRAAKAAPQCAKGAFVHLPCSIAVHPAVPDSCRRYYAVISRDTFIAAFRMYALLYGLSALGRRKGLNLRVLLPAAIRSGAFISVFSLLYAIGNCTSIRYLGGSYPRGYFASAFIAAFCSILVEQRSRRAELMLYTANVAAESVFNMAVNRGYVKPLRHGAIYVFAAAWASLLYLNHESPSDLDNAKGIVDTVHGRRYQPDSWDVKLAAMYLQATRGGASSTPSSPVITSTAAVMNGHVAPIVAAINNADTIALASLATPATIGGVTIISTSASPTISTTTSISPSAKLAVVDGNKVKKPLFPVPAWLAIISTPRHRDRARQWLLDNDMAYTAIGAVRGFLLGFALKGGMSLAAALFSPKKLLQLKWYSTHMKDSIHFGSMACAISGGARGVAALVKLARGGVHDGFNEAIGGAIAGSAFIMSGNKEVAMYLLSKATAGWICHAFTKSKVAPPRMAPEVLYALNTAIIFYQSAFESHNLRSSYWKFLLRVTNGHIQCFKDLAPEWRAELGIPGPIQGTHAHD